MIPAEVVITAGMVGSAAAGAVGMACWDGLTMRRLREDAERYFLAFEDAEATLDLYRQASRLRTPEVVDRIVALSVPLFDFEKEA